MPGRKKKYKIKLFCSDCGKPFISERMGRKRCYECSPPYQYRGKKVVGRKDRRR